MTKPSSHPSPEGLLEHAEWLRALARRLVLDDAQADDVVQETWLAALRRPPRDPGGARAWLATTARRIVTLGRVRAAHRTEREQARSKEGVSPSADDVAAQLEAEQRLVEAVRSLEEPYRSAIFLRYYRGLEPREIAQELGIPASTVRSHLTRAIAQLRARLDRSWSGEGSWRQALAPVAGLASLGSVVTLGGVGIGSVVLKTKLVAAAAVVMLAAGFVWLAGQGSGNSLRQDEIETPSAAQVDPDRGGGVEFSRRTSPEEAPGARLRKSEGISKGSGLRVRVLDAEGLPRPGVPIVLEVERNPGREKIEQVVTQGTEAMAVFADVAEKIGTLEPNDVLAVRADVHTIRPPRIVLTPSALPTDVVTLTLPPTGSVRVRVVDAMGELVTGRGYSCELLLDEPMARAIEGIRRGALFKRPGWIGSGFRNSKQGELLYESVGLDLDLSLTVQVDGFQLLRMPGPTLPGEEVVFTVVTQRPIVTGRLIDEGGQPLREQVGLAMLRLWSGRSRVGGGYRVATDDQGRFRLVWRQDAPDGARRRVFLEMGEEVIERKNLLGAPGVVFDLPPFEGRQVIDVGDQVVRVQPRLFAGIVLDLHEEPISEVSVFLEDPGGQYLHLQTDEAGRFFARGWCEEDSWEVCIRKEGFERQDLRVLRGSDDLVVRLTEGESGPIPSTPERRLTKDLRLRLVDGAGEPLRRFQPLLFPKAQTQVVTDDLGRLRVKVPEKAQEFLLTSRGYRLEKIFWSEEEQLVVLHRGIPVEIVYTGVEVEPPFYVMVYLSYAGPDAEIRPRGGHGHSWEDAPRALLGVPWAGPYRVSWRVWRRRKVGFSNAASLEVTAPQVIEVVESDELQVFRLEIPRTAFLAAREKLK